MREKSKEIVRKIINELVSTNPIYEKMIEGCDETEILAIEAAYNINLPISYREFLSAFGKCNRTIFDGFDISYPEPLYLTRSIFFEEIALAEEEYTPPYNISHDIFVIGSCYHEEFWFILTDDKSEGTAIYFASVYQRQESFKYNKCCDSIWEFMKGFVNNLQQN